MNGLLVRIPRCSLRLLFSHPFRTTAVVLALVYLATMAPGLTLWDAGEFQSAAATLGIPHPPGAPLYVLVARAWTLFWPADWFSVAMNALSVVSSAAMGGAVAWLFSRWVRSDSAGITAGLVAGLVYSVWQNATETEVYAVSLLLGVIMLVAGERAGETRDQRWNALLAYTLGVAGSLHLDALLAAPAAVLLATTGAGQRALQLRAIAGWGAPVLLALGLGRASPALMALAGGWLVLHALLPLPGARIARARDGGVLALLVALGASSALFMLVRAAHDPGINQGDPSNWPRFLAVLARDQYDVAGIWPRRAPLWLQVANLLQYLDWQFAFGWDGRTTFSFLRAPVTSFFVALAWVGARAHWARDARTARAWLMYVLVGALGALAVLNLQAGPSIGWGILPADAGHEARERDYFFVVAFMGVAAWAAVGAHELVRTRSAHLRRFAPLLLAALLVAGNWAATNRRREPDASIPIAFADAILMSAPPNAVLLMAGDNDTYTVWHAQRVRHLRPDLVPVTLPLLGADWYRQELRRRYGLLSAEVADQWQGLMPTLTALQFGAAAHHRPFASSLAVESSIRNGVSPSWTMHGLVYVSDTRQSRAGVMVDSVVTDAVALRLSELDGRTARDGTSRYLQRLLRCPSAVRSAEPDSAKFLSLASICNFR